jgi:NAD(P)-dependent dehydrogenase (short-subunit alcohol dehydrogenase family)
MTDKSVLVTGTSSGIGLETAVHLAERGFRVYATMRDMTRRDALDAEAASRDVQLQVLRLDITDKASIDSAVEAVLAHSGEIYGLVNNAGIVLWGYFEDLSEAEMRRVFETNVFGTMAVTRAVLPHMRAAGRGRIAIVTSVGGKMGSQALSAYCASKFALEGFGESLALELRPLGVQVALVEPGITDSRIWKANRNVARGALDPGSPYYDWFQGTRRVSDRLVRSSPITCEQIARSIHRALTTDKPRLRYLIGRRAKLVFALRRCLPGHLFERVYFGERACRLARGE